MLSPVEKSILATLVYYHLLKKPLTDFEIFKYLINPKHLLGDQLSTKPCFAEIRSLLKKSPHLKKLVQEKNGLYFLRQSNYGISQRIAKQKLAEAKWKKARRLIRFLPLIPYLRMVLVSGSLALNNPREESDIDLMIISQEGRIWTCRALVTFFFQLLGQRRHGSLTKNRFCLNHYLVETALKISFKSLYNAQTYAQLIPLWQARPGLFQQFQKNNSWIGDYLLSYPLAQGGWLREVRVPRLFNSLRKTAEFCLEIFIAPLLELVLKKIQEKKISQDRLTYQAGGRVVFNDQQLEFHPASPEESILRKYNLKMKKLGLGELAQEKNSGLLTKSG